MVEPTKTPLLQRIEALELLSEQLLQVAINQAEIINRIVDQLKTNTLSEKKEKDTGLILPARLNS